MKKEIVYTMPYDTESEKAEAKELRSKLYEKFNCVEIYPNGNYEVRIIASDEIQPAYDLAEDHANIKRQIKEWEKTIDHVIRSIRNDGGCGVTEDLEGITQEMMAINI